MKVTPDIPIALLVFLTAYLSIRFNKMDIKGAFFGVILSFIIWPGGGLESLLALFLFFVFGSLGSSWEKSVKKHYNLAQENDGKRGTYNVLANGGVGGILSIIANMFPAHQDLLRLMIIASFATACSDTLSSELGNIYGKKYVNIITLKQSKRGLDGNVSIQGLWFGLLGSFLISLSVMPFHYSMQIIIIITLCGLAGNIMDSILGATLQRRGFLNNHLVNFWATLFGALMMLIYELL